MSSLEILRPKWGSRDKELVSNCGKSRSEIYGRKNRLILTLKIFFVGSLKSHVSESLWLITFMDILKYPYLMNRFTALPRRSWPSHPWIKSSRNVIPKVTVTAVDQAPPLVHRLLSLVAPASPPAAAPPPRLLPMVVTLICLFLWFLFRSPLILFNIQMSIGLSSVFWYG